MLQRKKAFVLVDVELSSSVDAKGVVMRKGSCFEGRGQGIESELSLPCCYDHAVRWFL